MEIFTIKTPRTSVSGDLLEATSPTPPPPGNGRGFFRLQSSRLTHQNPHPTTSPNAKTSKWWKVAGWVTFTESGIEQIGELTIAAPDIGGRAASFIRYNRPKIAEGTVPGYVKFTNAGITSVEDLTITYPDNAGHKAGISGCDIRLPAEFLGPEYPMDDTFRQKKTGKDRRRQCPESRCQHRDLPPGFP